MICILDMMELYLYSKWRSLCSLTQKDIEVVRSHPVIGTNLRGIHIEMVVRFYDFD